ncbi:MAG: (d)CMP kinase [Coriobacteriia bacterium]
MIVAIDGPAASGKSTVARALARRLGFAYLDTGAMYRAASHVALRRGVPLDDADRLGALAASVDVRFEGEEGDPVPLRVFADGEDVTALIRAPAVDAAVSAVARIPLVRAAMVAQQRAATGASDTVVEGRDIGTVVFPDAAVKVFLTASSEERARRRQVDLSDAGHEIDEADVRERLDSRDAADSARETSPLAVAEDAVILDTTGLSIEQVVERIASLVREA